jgi:PAS domain S-box-containing protein
VIGGDRPRAAVDPARWLTGLEAIDAVELPAALDEIAHRIHDVVPVDLVTVHIVDELDSQGLTRGYCLGPSAGAQALAPLLTPEGVDPIGVGDAAREAGQPVVWPRIVSEPAEISRLARMAEEGGPAGALHRLLLNASGLAVPIGTAHRPDLGAIALVSLSREAPAPESAIEVLTQLAPQVALTARNHQLAARSRRSRQTLEAVISSSPMGVVVTDLRGRLSLANRAAAEMLGIALEPLIGQPIRRVLDERVKWRFVNPEDFVARVREAFADPGREARLEAETVDGRAIGLSSSPVHDAGGGVLGRVLILHDVSPARDALAEARRLAADRAMLLEGESRRAGEEMGLSRAAHMLASAVTPIDIGERLLEHLHRLVPRCDKSALLTVDREGHIVPVVTSGFSPASVKGMDYRAGEGVVGRVIVTRRPFICNDTEVDSRISTRLTGPEGIRSFMHVPIVLGDRVYGMVSVNSAAPRAFGERELRVVGELARHAAGSLRHALRFEQERHIAETLQEALISDRLPEAEGLALAALYEPAAGSQVGGDFYTAWPMPDGRLALLVGDVSGKGVEAAGVTAMVRYMAEALSTHCADPAQLVGELNDLMCPRMPDGSLVTLVLAMIDTARDEILWCVAGHPPPVVLTADGGYRRLDDPDPPCGIFPGIRFRTGAEPFHVDDALVLYTDGLIEARRRGAEFGEASLRDVLMERREDDPDTLARAAYAAARAWCGGRLGDDVAIAVVRRPAAPTGAPRPAVGASSPPR